MRLLKKIKKDNIIFFIIGAILFSGIGTAVATTILSSTVSYTNNGQTTIEGALDELYTRSGSFIDPQPIKSANLVYKYWNDTSGRGFYLFEAPDDVYTTRAALETANGSSNFTKFPIYIRSAFKGNTPIYHEVCYYWTQTGKEFCLPSNYWVGDSQDQIDGSTTKAKLKADLEASLGTTIPSNSCNSTTNFAQCYFDYFSFSVHPNEFVRCYSDVTNTACYIFPNGVAACF